MKQLLLLVVIALSLWRLTQFLDVLNDGWNSAALWNKYQNSAYFRGDKADFILSDDEVNAVRGFQLVDQREDLEKMLPGHPPLASWFMGTSARYLGHPLWANLVVTGLCLLLLWKIGNQLLGPTRALLLMGIFLAEPLVGEQITKTMLDIYLLGFCLAAIYFYSLWSRSPKLKWIFLSQLCLGLAMTTKFWLAAFPLVLALYLSTVLTDGFDRFYKHTLALTGIGLGFVLGHWQYFIFHLNPLEFARFQRYLISWWAGSPQVSAGAVWDLVLANRWHTWWGDSEIVATTVWWWGWPLGLVFAIAAAIKILKTRTVTPVWLGVILWIGLSLLMFNFSATYPRHLLVILPAIYILALSILQGKTSSVIS